MPPDIRLSERLAIRTGDDVVVPIKEPNGHLLALADHTGIADIYPYDLVLLAVDCIVLLTDCNSSRQSDHDDYPSSG